MPSGIFDFDRRQFSAAETEFRRALQIRRATFGRDHASLSMIYMNIGVVLTQRNAHEKAEGMFLEALRIQRINDKQVDPDTAQILAHFAKLLHKMKRHAEAHEMEARSARIRAELEYTVPASQLGIFTNRYSSDHQW